MKPKNPNFGPNGNLLNLLYKLVLGLSLKGFGVELARQGKVADAPWKDNKAHISDWKCPPQDPEMDATCRHYQG